MNKQGLSENTLIQAVMNNIQSTINTHEEVYMHTHVNQCASCLIADFSSLGCGEIQRLVGFEET
jgi:hypothetical protein